MLLQQAYAAQMEAQMKAEDAMIRQVEKMTVIERLPSTTFTAAAIANLGPDEKECSICMEEYQAGDKIRFLPCMHVFRQSCIDDWLARNLSCPICGGTLQAQLSEDLYYGDHGQDSDDEASEAYDGGVDV